MSNKLERVQKLISNYGGFSRRQVDQFISEGRVKVNGSIISLGFKATINDKIEINNKEIKLNLKHEYFLLNKPKGYICSRNDKWGKEVISLIRNHKKRNLFTVGRLDVNTTGLIIITSDGDFSNKITSPKNNIKKTYLVWVDKPINKKISLSLQKGIKLDDGYVTMPTKNFKIISNTNENVCIKMTILEGKKNQIKRMFESHNRKVINLKRIQIENLKIDGLAIGQYKKLSYDKIHKLLNLSF